MYRIIGFYYYDFSQAVNVTWKYCDYKFLSYLRYNELI